MLSPDLDTRQRWGLTLLQVGMITVMAALPISIALMNTGLAVAWIGALVARAPVHRTVGFWWGIVYAGWQVVSRLAGWIEGREVGGGFGMMYTWTGLCLAQVAFSGSNPAVIRARAWALRLLIISTVVAALVAIGQFTIGHEGSAKPLRIGWSGRQFEHATGLFAIHLTFGAMMMQLVIIAAGGALSTWLPGRCWRWILGLAAGLGLLLSMGRLAFVGVAAGISAMIAVHGRRYLVTAILVGVALLGLGVAAMAMIQPDRLKAMTRLEDGRWPIWRTSMAMVEDRPWFGLGSSRAYKIDYQQRYDQVNPGAFNEFPRGAPHAHNAPLSLAAEHGLPLVVLWLAFLGAVLWQFQRRSKANPAAWRTAVALVVAYVVAGQFEHLAGDGESSHALWTLLGGLLSSLVPDESGSP
jgi:O-antigen ligase